MVAPLRVLHLCAGNLYGGVERIVGVCASGRAVCPSMEPVVAVCFSGRLSAELHRAGRSAASLGPVRFRRPWTLVRARRLLRGTISEIRPEVVLCHSAWMHAIAAPVVRHAGVCLATWIHDRVSGRPWIERRAHRTQPDVVIANSAYTAASVPALFPNAPCTVVHPPVPPPDPQRRAERTLVRRGLGVTDETPVVLVASRFEAWKGHRELLVALSHVVDPWQLWIAGGPQRPGESEYGASLRGLCASLGLERRVAFLGERADVSGLMAAADIYCQPNTGPEPFGLAFVEALDAELPVVTRSIGGAREIVTGSCGVLVAPGDDEGLAAALRRLIAHPEDRRRLGAAGPSRARTLCDPQRQLEALAAALAPARVRVH